MEKVKHHNYFQVYMPKNRDPNNMDMVDVFMEEAHLMSDGQMTPTYEYDAMNRKAEDVVLYPSFIYASRELHKNDVFGQDKFINDCIDAEFVKMTFSVDPVYKIGDFIEYHYQKHHGDEKEFIKHIRYVILPLIRTTIENSNNKDSYLYHESTPQFETIREVIEEWMNNKIKEVDNSQSNFETTITNTGNVFVNNQNEIKHQANLSNKPKEENRTFALSFLIIAIVMLAIALIVDWEKIVRFFI